MTSASVETSTVVELERAKDERPTIRFHPSRFAPQVRAAVAALRKRGGIYVNGDRLVVVARASVEHQEASAWVDSLGRKRFGIVTGAPAIVPLTHALLKMHLAEAARFQKYVASRGGWNDSAPPDDIVSSVFDDRSCNLPPLIGVTETPILRPDGTIAAKHGYDARSGYFVAPREPFPAIDAKPTKDDAVRAYRALAEIFCDFPFATDAGAAVPIAALLTLFARPAIAGAVPGIAIDAPNGGVGKTLASDAVAEVATGNPAPRKAYPSTEEELEKVLAAYAARGSTLIAIDDIKRPLGGENLDRVLTARDTVDFRRLGVTELVTARWRAVLFFTGCNLSFFGQMARRLLVARLESTLERPQDRSNFRHPQLLEWVRANRPGLVAAALTILRAFVVAGAPDMGCARWGSFEEWSRFIPHAIAFSGGPDVLSCRPPDDDEDSVADVAMLRTLFAQLRALCDVVCPLHERSPAEGLTVGEIVAAVFKGEAEQWRELRTALRDLTRYRSEAGAPSPSAVGSNLARHKGRPLRVGEELLRLVKVKNAHKGGSDRWVVEPIT